MLLRENLDYPDLLAAAVKSSNAFNVAGIFVQARRADGIAPPVDSGSSSYLERVRCIIGEADRRVGLVSNRRISLLSRTGNGLNTKGVIIKPYAIKVVPRTMLATKRIHDAAAEDLTDLGDGKGLPELDMPHLALGKVRRVDRSILLAQ
jgi:hypothetical protein